jgi:hypothetical protein
MRCAAPRAHSRAGAAAHPRCSAGTNMDSADLRGDLQQPEPEQEHVYRPKPPLWRPARERRRSAVETAVMAVGTAVLASVLGAFLLEGHLLSTPAKPMPVTITAIESAGHGDEESRGITYRVSLPNGAHGRFTSEHTYAIGTRLTAMVAHGRITGRIFVTSPYAVLPNK